MAGKSGDGRFYECRPCDRRRLASSPFGAYGLKRRSRHPAALGQLSVIEGRFRSKSCEPISCVLGAPWATLTLSAVFLRNYAGVRQRFLPAGESLGKFGRQPVCNFFERSSPIHQPECSPAQEPFFGKLRHSPPPFPAGRKIWAQALICQPFRLEGIVLGLAISPRQQAAKDDKGGLLL